MRYRRQSSFDRTYRQLSSSEQARVEQALSRFVRALDSGERGEGLGLKKLKLDFWEIRAGLSIRILFKLERELATFIIVGTHDEIHRFLKHV